MHVWWWFVLKLSFLSLWSTNYYLAILWILVCQNCKKYFILLFLKKFENIMKKLSKFFSFSTMQWGNEINVNNFWYKIYLIEILIGLTQLDENFKFVQFHGIFWPNDWLAMNHVLVVGVDQLQLSREKFSGQSFLLHCVWMHMTSRYHHFL